MKKLLTVLLAIAALAVGQTNMVAGGKGSGKSSSSHHKSSSTSSKTQPSTGKTVHVKPRTKETKNGKEVGAYDRRPPGTVPESEKKDKK